ITMGPRTEAEMRAEAQLNEAAAAEAQTTPRNGAGLPLLHSNPEAFAKLFLDFDGYPQWGRPAWGTDGDPTTFSDSEAASITAMWEAVSEKYAPFNIDVTTDDPGPRDPRHIAFVTISRTDYGTGGSAGVGGFAAGVSDGQ